MKLNVKKQMETTDLAQQTKANRPPVNLKQRVKSQMTSPLLLVRLNCPVQNNRLVLICCTEHFVCTVFETWGHLRSVVRVIKNTLSEHSFAGVVTVWLHV